MVREPDGWFRFVDRIKDVIRRRGENISSYEVASAVRSHPAVFQAAAFPVASELAEDEVMVAVVVRPGSTLDPADLARHCAHELSRFAVPRYIEMVPALPLTETGKVRTYGLGQPVHGGFGHAHLLLEGSDLRAGRSSWTAPARWAEACDTSSWQRLVRQP